MHYSAGGMEGKSISEMNGTLSIGIVSVLEMMDFDRGPSMRKENQQAILPNGHLTSKYGFSHLK